MTWQDELARQYEKAKARVYPWETVQVTVRVGTLEPATVSRLFPCVNAEPVAGLARGRVLFCAHSGTLDSGKIGTPNPYDYDATFDIAPHDWNEPRRPDGTYAAVVDSAGQTVYPYRDLNAIPSP